MKIAKKAFDQYKDIDPREIDINSVAKRIDYEYAPLLWVFFFGGMICATMIIIALFILAI